MTNKKLSKDVFRKRRLWAGIAASVLTACALPANADSFTYTGAAQSFTASTAGIYQIVAYGAQGGSSNNYQSPVPGGAGAEIGASFFLSAGETLSVDVGGQGVNSDLGGGGGGTFVVALNGTPLVIAGGGGGADFGFDAGQPGLATTSGGDGGINAAGGSGGQGGQGGGQYGGGGGAGFYGNGGNGLGNGGSDYPGLAGGAGYDGVDGGYGGGGGAGEFYGGGGGGYSGGGGGDDTGNSAGGGGGSYLDASATDTILLSGVEMGNGSVTITELMATAPEPGSLTLFGFGMGLVGIGLVVPRKSCSTERSRD